MELATVHLKLSGQTQNTVVKHNVTPAQLSMYAFMHGEDCVQALTVTSVDKKRTIPQEMNRLRMEFTTEHAVKSMAQLFPGMHPQLPVSFQSIGYDPEFLRPDNAPAYNPPQVSGNAAAKIRDKIKEAEDQRKAEANGTNPVSPVSVVTPQDMTDTLDDTGGFEEDEDDDDDNALDLGDDPIDAELSRMQEPATGTEG